MYKEKYNVYFYIQIYRTLIFFGIGYCKAKTNSSHYYRLTGTQHRPLHVISSEWPYKNNEENALSTCGSNDLMSWCRSLWHHLTAASSDTTRFFTRHFTDHSQISQAVLISAAPSQGCHIWPESSLRCREEAVYIRYNQIWWSSNLLFTMV